MGKKQLIEELEIQNANLKKEVAKYKKQLESQKNGMKDEIEKEKNILASIKSEISFVEGLRDEIEFGIYYPKLDFEHKDYIEEWKVQREKLKVISKDKETIVIESPMKLGGSEAKGTKLQKDIAKLGIVHLNNFANVQFKNTTNGNYEVQIAKFDKEFDKVNKIISPLKVNIDSELRDEIVNSFDFVIKMKMQKENDAENARLERERIREEEKLQREIDRKVEKINNEVEKYNLRLKEIQAGSDAKDDEIQKLKDKIEALKNDEIELHERLKRTGAGYVYIISNIGSFGEGIYKIGVTRRLEPEVRVRELSSASVPFIFDIHAMIWSEKAFDLETRLHKVFTDRRVNKINMRKEFFRTNLDDIKGEVKNITDTTVKWIDEPEAIQYRLTLEDEDGRNN